MTNKILASKVNRICVAYDGMDAFFPKEKTVKTGNPVRASLVHLPEQKTASLAHFDLNRDKQTLLVLGGSLGARRINELIEEQLPNFKKLGLQLIWQCGSLYYDRYKKYESEFVKVRGYLNHMEHAYKVADVIISRSGAGSVSELCLVGKPVLFIPSPNVAEDHQTKNAQALVNADAALMIQEKNLEIEFKQHFEELLASKKKMDQLGKNIKELALPRATEHIVDEIVQLIREVDE
jgi:UDP-N-acetylglucosamine--N-acetylmuramyl-(pentapeptide) pyrophosphoryl-undecaprenol N-acetylglucosamine transferase